MPCDDPCVARDLQLAGQVPTARHSLTVPEWRHEHWTIADLVPRFGHQGPKTSTPRRSLHRRVEYHGKSNDAGLAGMLPGEIVARPSLRWEILHRCAQHQNLLPLRLP